MQRTTTRRHVFGLALLLTALLSGLACSGGGTAMTQIDFEFADTETLAAPEMPAVGDDVAWFYAGGQLATVSSGTLEVTPVLDPEDGVNGMLADGNDVWLVLDSDGTLVRLSPDGTQVGEAITYRVQNEDSLGFNSVELVRVGDEMWLAATSHVRRINLETREVLPDLDIVLAGDLIVTDDAVLMNAEGHILRVDPTTGEVLTDRDMGNAGPALALGDGELWALTGNDQIHRLDPDTLEPTGEPLDVGDDISSLVYGGGYLWSRDSNEIVRIDPENGDILERYSLRSPYSSENAELAAFAFGAGKLWVGTDIGNRAGVIELD